MLVKCLLLFPFCVLKMLFNTAVISIFIGTNRFED